MSATAKSAFTWLETRRAGLYVVPADLYIDPVLPVARAAITHGHADHARSGHDHVYATPQTLAIMACRYGEAHAATTTAMEYGDTIALPGGVELHFAAAGHILGSAQISIAYRQHRVTVSGDYKRRADPTCAPFQPQQCDVFITEATFALPIFKHPPIEQELRRLLQSMHDFPGSCHLLGAYALGKCQRIMMTLRQLGYTETIYLHGAQVKLVELYESLGIPLGVWRKVSDVTDKQELAGKLVLAPPSALADRWSRKLPEVLTCMASGWMQIRARAKQRRAELPLIISDHADWNELLETLQEINAPQVWVTHGREEALVHQAKAFGYKAQALSLLGYDEEAS